MIFYFNSKGEPCGYRPERIFQGSNEVNDLFFVSPAPAEVAVTAEFLLPDGSVYGPKIMKLENGVFPGVRNEKNEKLNVWHCVLPFAVTSSSGTVAVQFFVYSQMGEILSTATDEFLVERGVLSEEPEKGDSYGEVITFLASLNTAVKNLGEDVKDVTALNLKDGEGVGSVEQKDYEINGLNVAGGKASGEHSAAFGRNTEAKGEYSFAAGFGASAVGEGQVSVGVYNEEDNEAVFAVGNGNKEVRKSAFAVKRNGRVIIPAPPQEDEDAANKGYVNSAIENSISDSFTDGAANKALSAKKGKELKALIDTKEYSKSFLTVAELVTHLNEKKTKGDYWTSFNFNVVQTGVPDFWVVSVEDVYSEFPFAGDDDFVKRVQSAPVQVGYYKLSCLETAKMDLSDYVKKTDYADDVNAGVVKADISGGIGVENGSMRIVSATEEEISFKSDSHKPITCNRLNFAVKKGLADPGAGKNPANWSEEEKTAARKTISAISAKDLAVLGEEPPTSETAADFIGQRYIAGGETLYTCTSVDGNGKVKWKAEADGFADENDIETQSSSSRWISPKFIACAVKEALIRPTKSDTPAVWSDEDKAAARATIGVTVQPQDIVNLIYPVGSVYISVNSSSPAALFGGAWEKIEGRFLLAAGAGYSLGSTGGEKEHTLSVKEMPSHAHTQTAHNHGFLSPTTDTNLWSGNAIGGGRSTPDNAWYPAFVDAGTDKGKQYLKKSASAPSGYNWEDSVSPTVNSAGAGEAHNNMPPYFCVNVWKRTA